MFRPHFTHAPHPSCPTLVVTSQTNFSNLPVPAMLSRRNAKSVKALLVNPRKGESQSEYVLLPANAWNGDRVELPTSNPPTTVVRPRPPIRCILLHVLQRRYRRRRARERGWSGFKPIPFRRKIHRRGGQTEVRIPFLTLGTRHNS